MFKLSMYASSCRVELQIMLYVTYRYIHSIDLYTKFWILDSYILSASRLMQCYSYDMRFCVYAPDMLLPFDVPANIYIYT